MHSINSAGILEQFMGAGNRVGTGFVVLGCPEPVFVNVNGTPGIDSAGLGIVSGLIKMFTNTGSSYIGWRNRFQGSLKRIKIPSSE
jgi:hypothetical protein